MDEACGANHLLDPLPRTPQCRRLDARRRRNVLADGLEQLAEEAVWCPVREADLAARLADTNHLARCGPSQRTRAYFGDCGLLSRAGEEARTQMAAIRKRLPGYRVDDFLTAMQFAPESAELFREGARRIG